MEIMKNLRNHIIIILALSLVVCLVIVLVLISIFPSLDGIFYIIIGSLISAIMTIIWNSSNFIREGELKKKENEDLIRKTNNEVISILSEVWEASKLNLNLIEKKSVQLHPLQTGFWELSIKNIPLDIRAENEFFLLRDIHLGVNFINKLILDRETILLKRENDEEEWDPEKIDKLLIENFNLLKDRTNEYKDILDKLVNQ